jgi:parallel beta-helix repeat protein
MTKVLKPVCLIAALALVLSLGAVFVPGSVVLAADTGQKSPTANYGPSATDWSIPTYAYADDGNTTAGPHGALQIYHDYGFSIPAGSTIDGIEVTLEGAYFSESNPGDPTTAAQIKVEVSWGGGATGTISGTRTQVITGTATTYTIGGAADTWGHSWTVSELSDANFRVRIFAETTPTTAGHFARLDWLPVTVYYTAPALVPSITSVSPGSGHRGATQDVTITGENFTGTTTVSFGSGITVNGFTEDSDTQITADITIAGVLTGNTTLGTRDVSVTTAGGTGTLTAGFTVTAPSEVWVDDGYSDSGANDGHTWGVDAFANIQDGIDAVGASTVNVLPGTYNEAVSITKDLVLQTTGSAEETIIQYHPDVVTVDLDGETVVIDGFTIAEGTAPTSGIHVDYLYDGSSLTVKDCIITQNYGRGIYAWSIEEDSSLIIEDNTVSDNDYHGIDIEYVAGGSSVTISGNTITDNGDNWEGDGCGIYLGTVDASTVTIDDENTITGNAGDGIYNGSMQDASTYEITGNNNISSNGDDGVHIHLYEDSIATIHDNIINDNTENGIYVSEVFGGGDSSELVADYNTISDNGNCGVLISEGGMDEDYLVTISDCNDIFDNSEHGVYNESGYMVDATENWWGDESGPDGAGPGSGDSISGDVDYEPWLRAPCGEEGLPPVAAARANPPTGQAPHPVQFYDMSTGDIDEWYWTFGDGSSSTAQYPTHTYQNEGNFQVCLTVEGPGGSDTVCMEVLVETAAGAPNLVVRNLYISATQAQPRQQVVITADVFNEGEAWGDGDMDLIINGQYEQTVGVGVAPGTSQPISFTVYKVPAGEYQVTIGNATGTFYVVEEQQTSQLGSIPMDCGTLIALIVIGVLVIAALIVVIVILKPS